MKPPRPTGLPRSYRWALVTAVVLGFQVALSAAFDVQGALSLDEPPPMVGKEAELPGLGLSPLAQRQVWLASVSGYKSALQAMLPWRLGTSLLLSISAGLVFFLAMRLRVSLEDRVAVAVNLGRASLAAAIFRSIDGAESLVMARTIADETGKAFVREGLANADIALMTAGVSFASGAWTLMMVAGFVTLGHYFRSETLRDALGRAEP